MAHVMFTAVHFVQHGGGAGICPDGFNLGVLVQEAGPLLGGRRGVFPTGMQDFTPTLPGCG